MTHNLYAQARELGEWLRGEARRQCACVRDTVARLDCVRCGGTGVVVNSTTKSRAETLESILADNTRLGAELSAAWKAGYDAAVSDCAASITAGLCPDIEEAVCAVVRKRVNLLATKL